MRSTNRAPRDRAAGPEPTPLSSFLDSAFRIRTGEAKLVFLMLSYLMCVVSTFIIGRTVRDTLFLHRVSLDTLALMYVAVSAAVALASWRYSYIADAYRSDKLITGFLLLFCTTVCGFWALIRFDVGAWVYFGLYIAVEILGAISMMQFWTFANDVFSGRQAKRLFGFIGAGAVLSNIFCGFGIGAVAPFINSEDLLLVAGLLFVSAIAMVRSIASIAGADLEIAVAQPRRSKLQLGVQGDHVLASRHLRIIAAIVIVTFVTVTVIDYQFKVLVRLSTDDEAKLATYFGYFYAFTGIIASTIQFLVTGRLLERAGIVVALSVLPVALAVGATSVLAVPLVSALAAATIIKGAENVFRYTVNDATTQLLYVPVPGHRRGRAKAFIDGIIKPASIAASGLMLYIVGRWISVEPLVFGLAYLDLALLTGWLGLVIFVRREYIRSLIDTLRSHRLDVSGRWAPVVDESTHRLVKQRLQTDDEAEILITLELLPSLDADFHDDLLRLLAHPSAQVRIRALDLIGDSGRLEGVESIRTLFQDPSPSVRSAAIRAFCAVGRDRATQTVRKFLNDADSQVRASAVSALITYGGLDGILTAAEALKHFLESRDAKARLHGAHVLRDIRVRNFFQPVLKLLQDEDPRVRVAAVEAAGAMQSPELVLALIYKLADPIAAMAAVRALVAHGADVERALFKVLQNPHEDIRVRRRLPRILEQIGGHTAFERLLSTLSTKDPELKTQVARAAARIRERHPQLPVDETRLNAVFREQVEGAYQTLGVLLDLQLPADHLLAEALNDRFRSYISLAFGVLEIRYPTQTIQLVRANLEANDRSIRANALEIIDNVLAKEESRLLLPLLEDGYTLLSRVQKGRELVSTISRSADDWMTLLLDDPHPWIVSCTLHHVAGHGLTELIDHARRHLDSKDPIVRETAVVALDRLLTAMKNPPAVDNALTQKTRELARDDVTEVRRAAERLLSTLGLTPAPSA